MKRIKIWLITILIISTTLNACKSSESVNVYVSKDDEITGNTFGISNLIKIGNNLYYDTTTRIVYFWNGCLNKFGCDTTPTPYYSPNGKPYRYNPETNTFDKIN